MGDLDMVEIYFRDLTKEAQRAVLRVLRIKDPSEENYDIFPLFYLEAPEITGCEKIHAGENDA